MAVVSTKKKDPKYDHLQKLYTKENQQSQKKSVEAKDENAKSIERKIVVTRTDMLMGLGIVTVLTLLGLSGYLISRI